MVFIVFLQTDHKKIGEDNLLRLHKRFLHNFMEKNISETEIKLEIELVQCSYYAVYSLVPIIRPAQIADPVGILYLKK